MPFPKRRLVSAVLVTAALGGVAAVAAPSAAFAATPQSIAAGIVPAGQFASFEKIISKESGWNIAATNPQSGAYGLGQALPASKMASAGPDWKTNPKTQITWAYDYMNSRYGSPNNAWDFWQAHNWY